MWKRKPRLRKTMFPEVKKNDRIKIYTRKKTRPEVVNGVKVFQVHDCEGGQ